MNEKDGKNEEIAIPSDKKKVSKDISTPNILDKKEKRADNELKLEDLLENDDYIYDLNANSNSRFIKILTTENIKKLIDYCLLQTTKLDENSTIAKRYPYYSCQILCSERVLLFSKSIDQIKESNNLKLSKKEIDNNDKKITQASSQDKKEESTQISLLPINSIDINNINEEFYDNIDSNIYKTELEKPSFDDYFKYKSDIGNEERYVEISETEIKKNTISIKPITDYDKEEKQIIDDILNEIFQVLKEEKKENLNNYTYIGYFQKIVNYLLFNEENIIMDYLFRDPERPIKLFYKHLDKAAMENIIENILNILVDREDNLIDIQDSKYNNIILDMLIELASDVNFEKVEYVFDLIINTLINNSDKHLIELIFNKNKCILVNLRTFIEVIINREKYRKNENNDKTIIGVLKILNQLNTIIMDSFKESLYYKKNNKHIDIPINVYIKVNTFEYQYVIKRGKTIKKIFDAYNDNINIYLEEMIKIFNLIKEDIVNKYKENIGNKNNKEKIEIKFNKEIETDNNVENKEKIENNKINNNKNNKSKNKIFNLRHLSEWEFIANTLSLYIYSFYAIDKFDSYTKNSYFNCENLFKIMNKYYFNYPKNNIYQNTFTEIIKLICNEKCPKYLLKHFLKEKNNKRNKFISKIIKNIKEEINSKNKLSLGTNIELLRIIYDSKNAYILKIFEKFEKDENSKNIFNDYMTPKLERKLLDEWEYSFSEIFNSENENNTTFDGNDIELKRNFDSFNKMTQIFLDKRKANKLNISNNNDNDANNVKIKIKEKEENYKYGDILNTIKATKKIIEYEKDINENNNEKEPYFGIVAEEMFESEETTINDKIPANT